MSTRRPSSYLRVGDAERDRAIAALGEHFAAGRLTKLEHEERTELALRARTGADLDALFADLPTLDSATARPTARRRRRGWPMLPQPVMAVLAGLLALFVVVQLIPVFAAIAIFFLVTRLMFGRRCGWHRVATGALRRW